MSVQTCYKASHELEVVEVPANVKNVDKMIKALGGIDQISKALSGNETLKLSFHPDNPYTRPLQATAKNKCGILLSVKERRSKRDPSKPPKYFISIAGHSKRIFTFDTPADIQYLPIFPMPSADGGPPKMKCVLDRLLPNGPFDFEKFNNSPDMPLMAAASRFANFDFEIFDGFRSHVHEDGMATTLGVVQKSNYENRDIVNFSATDALPAGPDPLLAKSMKAKYVSDEQFATVRRLFDECPIWTRIGLIYESGITYDKLRVVLPALAFYYTSGPWRTLYIRYGYDPRNYFESRHYQTFDFRIRFDTGISEYVTSRKIAMKKKCSGAEDIQGDLTQDVDYPYLEENKLPRSRQCILRYCDVHLPKVQEMMSKVPTPKSGATCHEKNGWLPVNFDSQVRLVISEQIKELLQSHYKNKNVDAKVEACEADYVDPDEEQEEQLDGDEEYSEGVPED